MSRLSEAASRKRKIPDLSRCTHVDAEREVLSVVRSKKDIGIWAGDLKKETDLLPHIVEKALKSLEKQELIKLVKTKNKGKNHYMGVEFKPSEEVTGIQWHADKEFVAALTDICLKVLYKLKVATMKEINAFIQERELAVCTDQQVAQLLERMVLDNVLKEVVSNGLADYHSIPAGSLCYRIPSGPKPIGNMASIPCGTCPRISRCTPNGIISPQTCVYYTKWLKFEF